MRSWPEKMAVVGESTKRVDTPAKVTGEARYASDVQPNGWLYGMIFRSRWPAARVTRVNVEKARKMPGIKAAIVEREGERTVRFYGEELAAVAGVSKQACLDALRAIEIDATPLPFVVKEETAKSPDSPRVWPDTPNLADPNIREKGDVDKAFASAAAVVEGFFTTPVQLHHPLETHGNTISVTNDGVTCWASTQGIFSVREGLASYLDMSQEKVRVITDYMGGGFGSKFGPGPHGGLAARLSQAAGAPVKLMLTRFDQALAVGNRPSSFQKIRLGADAEGKLVAFDMDSFGTAGIGAGAASAGGGGGAGFPAPYIYTVPNIRVKQAVVAINAGQSCAFRAPGHPIASFGMESIMDELAVKLKMDPVDLRVKNDPGKIRQREYALGAERFGWKQKYKPPGSSPGPVKVGVGCAGATWGGGGRGSHAEAQINPDGSVEVRCGTQDLGTGSRTMVGVVAAEVFGLKPEQITIRIGDTLYPPSGASGGSTTAASVCPAIFDTCTNALQKLQQTTGVADARGANWVAACKKLGVNPLTAHGEWQEGLSSSGVGGVQFAEVEVDTETGFVKVRKVLCVQDCGLVVNKLTTETLINGGVIMGLGYALYEERVMDPTTGLVLNPNFETYKLPNFADVPDIEVVLMEMPERGVIGVGEPCTIPTASAIANAVANALGVRVPSLPITPARVLAALGKAVKPGGSV
ncbi:MAG TPA: xanthine dehydrogenase family protein molybdopterin-binding subunit [Verrucomicrobiae bacterium]|nr:xanthine dehydrogenase family protein molybdopterin-binding subunit [Verrucomicrobiae bacterium]